MIPETVLTVLKKLHPNAAYLLLLDFMLYFFTESV